MTPPPISHLDAPTAAGHSTNDTLTTGRTPRGMVVVRPAHPNKSPPRREKTGRTRFHAMPAR